MKRIVKYYRRYLNFHSRTLLLLDITFNFMFFVIIVPILNYGIKYVMKLKRLSYITAENAVEFFSYLPVVLLMLLLLFTIPILLLIKISAMVYYCNTESALKKPSLIRIIYSGFMKAFHIIKKGQLALCLFTIVFYLLTNIPLISIFIAYINPEYFKGTQDKLLIKGFIILGLLLISFISYRGFFTIHYCLNEHVSFSAGLERSKMLLKGRNKRTLFVFLFYNLLFTAAFFLLYYCILFVTALLVYFFSAKTMAVTVFLSVYPGINLYSTLFFSTAAFIININLISSLFRTYQEESFRDILPDDPSMDPPICFRNKKYRIIVNGFIIYVVIFGLVNFYLTVHNDSLYLREALAGIQISSHRGNSHISPENTLPALENAILAKSDFAEIDVQQTKDGVLVLLHDSSLWRTAGINRNIWDMNKAEIEQLDAGSWFGNDYMNTKIPTLEEVLIHCKGKIKLNIEIKVTGKIHGLEEKLVALIEDYEFEHRCIVSSSDYNALLKIKQLNEEIKTGYILSAAYGNFYDKDYIDFLSIRSSFITKHVVESAHFAGKEVHAWTVNTPKEIERMKSIGVDCIITDNPTLAREIIYRDDTNDNFIQLLRRMMKNRTLYRLSLLLN